MAPFASSQQDGMCGDNAPICGADTEAIGFPDGNNFIAEYFDAKTLNLYQTAAE